MPIINAKDLRIIENRKNIPSKAGWYRWWAKNTEVKRLLNDHYKYLFPLLQTCKEKSELNGYFLIYTGIAFKESVGARLNWHINQKHTSANVKHRTLSTLRQSISSLLFGNQGKNSEEETNKFINKLKVEYFTVDSPIGSDEAKKAVEDREKQDLGCLVLPLNIKGNKNPAILVFKKYLQKKRCNARKCNDVE